MSQTNLTTKGSVKNSLFTILIISRVKTILINTSFASNNVELCQKVNAIF